jgi:transposase
LKWRIVYLYNEGFSRKKISRYLYIGMTTVGNVLRIFNKWGCVESPLKGQRGRRKRFSVQNMEVLALLLCRNGKIYVYLLGHLFTSFLGAPTTSPREH